jgi:hypothetical protein
LSGKVQFSTPQTATRGGPLWQVHRPKPGGRFSSIKALGTIAQKLLSFKPENRRKQGSVKVL